MFITIKLDIFCPKCKKQQSKIQDSPIPKFCGFCGSKLSK